MSLVLIEIILLLFIIVILCVANVLVTGHRELDQMNEYFNLSPIFRDSFSTPLRVALGLVIAGLLMLVVLGPVIKLVGDVSRYIGLRSYRQDLHNTLREKVQTSSIDENTRVINAGHSLGSVIAVDSLLYASDMWL